MRGQGRGRGRGQGGGGMMVGLAMQAVMLTGGGWHVMLACVVWLSARPRCAT